MTSEAKKSNIPEGITYASIPKETLPVCIQYLLENYIDEGMKTAFPGENAGMASRSFHERQSAYNSQDGLINEWRQKFNALSIEEQQAQILGAYIAHCPWVSNIQRD